MEPLTEQLVNQMFSAPLNKLKAQESAQAIQYRGDLQQLSVQSLENISLNEACFTVVFFCSVSKMCVMLFDILFVCSVELTFYKLYFVHSCTFFNHSCRKRT